MCYKHIAESGSQENETSPVAVIRLLGDLGQVLSPF